MAKGKDPLKLMPLDDLKRVIAGMLDAPKRKREKPKPRNGSEKK